MNIYSLLRQLAKTSKYQNLFIACKDINGFKLFENDKNLSQIQEIFLNYLYMYNSINQAINVDKISPHVLDKELYEDCYLLWKNKSSKKEIQNETKSDVHLVASDTIIFPQKR